MKDGFDARKRSQEKMSDRRAASAAARRGKMLQSIKEGMGITAGWKSAGWDSDYAYRYNRRHFPEWAAQIDYYVALNRGLVTEELEGRAVPGEPTNHVEFVDRYFPERHPPLPHQIQIAEILENLEPREIVMVLLWPAAGKTSTLEDYICRRLADDPGHRFSYVSETQLHAKKIVDLCKRRFTETGVWEDFITRFGPFYEKGQERAGRPWAADQITVARNRGVERDRNLVARSWTSAVYGSRIDTLILDDLQSQNNINQSQEIFDVIRGTFFSRDSKDSELRTLIIGTRIRQGDVYQKFLEAGLVSRQIVLSAADTEGNPRVPEWWDRKMFHTGKGVCCPPMLRPCPKDGSKVTPREYMDLIRFQNGEEAWWSSYMQNPRAEERSTFAKYLKDCFDEDRAYGPLAGVR